MKEQTFEGITGKSEEQQILEDVAKIGQTNPEMQEKLSRLLAMAVEKKSAGKFGITPAMRAGAEANRRYHAPRQQGEE